MNRIRARGGFGATLAVLLGATAVGAQTFENGSGGSVRFYGQMSPTYLTFDDGEETTGNLVDNANSNTRLGFVIDQPAWGGGLVVTFETALGFVQSSEVSQSDTPPALDWQRTDLRKFEAAYSSDFGTLSLGQGSMATDGAAELDVSGTTIAGYSAISDVAGAFRFREDAGPLSDVTVSSAFKNLDGSRRFRIRYDTPKYSGASLAIAYGQDVLSDSNDTDYYDIALRWSGERGDYEMAAAAGYSWAEDGSTTEALLGSFSMLHSPTGLNLAVSAGSDPDGGSYGYVKGGWKAELIAQGATNVSIDYYSGSDFGTDGSSAEAWGVSAVQVIDDLDLEVYLGYRAYTYDDDAGSYEDASSVLFGARYRF
jgi:hypothetical protein